MSRRNNIADMTVREQIEAVKEEFCDHMCKHYAEAVKKCEKAKSEIATATHEDAIGQIETELFEEHCETCPLIRL